MMEHVDDTAAKVVLAASDGDSVRRISQKIGGTYSWVYTWVERLEEIGVLERDDGVHVTAPEVRDAYADLVAVISRRSPPTVEEAYVVPHFADLPFAFTRIDAVYVWTHGGYQVARGDDAYPVFVRVEEGETDRWLDFFERHDLPVTVDERDDSVVEDAGGVYYSLYPAEEPVEREWVDGNPVIPLAETVAYMEAYRWNFEPALAMVAEEYDVDVDADRPEYAPAS